MASWKYTPGRFILSVFLVLVIFRAVKLLFEVHAETRTVDSNAATSTSSSKEAAKIICEYDESNLASLVWSHRAHYSDEAVDGSEEAVKQLLKFGIRNFDVDVSCNVLPSSDSCEFVIAHPSVLADKEKLEHRNHIQTVSSFLNQIHTFVQAEKEVKPTKSIKVLMPLVTLEMKFTKLSHQIELAKLVQESPLAGNVAIIGSDPSILKNVLPYLTRSGIAAAYRTKPLSTHDFTWPEPTHIERHTLSSGGLFFGEQTEKQSFLPVPPPLVVVRSAAPLAPASTDANDPFAVSREYLQIYMPDVKLLKYPLLWQKVSGTPGEPGQNSAVIKSLHTENEVNRSVSTDMRASSDTGNQRNSTTTAAIPPSMRSAPSRDPQRLVVVWVVDTNAELFDAISKGVDGVISNRPVALLAELRSLYAQYCRPGGSKIK